MFVHCSNCHNHYDDSYQSEECFGIGRQAGTGGYPTSHPRVGQSAVESANAMARAARALSRPAKP